MIARGGSSAGENALKVIVKSLSSYAGQMRQAEYGIPSAPGAESGEVITA